MFDEQFKGLAAGLATEVLHLEQGGQTGRVEALDGQIVAGHQSDCGGEDPAFSGKERDDLALEGALDPGEIALPEWCVTTE